MKKKISIIGAGNVGVASAYWCAIKELGDITLWNRTKEKAIGNALDIQEASPLIGFDTKIKGTDNLNDTKDSDLIIFTSGSPRKPGMKREELVKTNAEVVMPLVKSLSKLSPKSIIVMVTNPLDAMTYAAFKASKFPTHRIIGMAGILDASRLKSFIAKELEVSINEISALVLGSHGEDMVPLPRLATVGGIELESLLTKSQISRIVEHTKQAGAEIVNLLQANASFSVGASVSKLAEAIIKDKKEILPCSAYLTGEYGLHEVFLGVPCVIGADGIERIIKFKLNSEEKKQLNAAALRIKELLEMI